MAVRRSDGVVFDMAGDRAVLLDPAGRELITLNPVGSLVWHALDGHRDAAGLAAALLPELSGVTLDVLERDIAEFLTTLAELGLVVDAAS